MSSTDTDQLINRSGSAKSEQPNHDKYKGRKIRDRSPEPLNRNRKKPWRSIFLSLFLLVAGILFLVVGIQKTYELGLGETYPFFIMSFILLCPGLYHTVIIVLVLLNVEGYSFQQLDQFEN